MTPSASLPVDATYKFPKVIVQSILNGTFLTVIAVAPTLVGKTATSTWPEAIIGTIVDGSVTVSKFSVIANAAIAIAGAPVGTTILQSILFSFSKNL